MFIDIETTRFTMNMTSASKEPLPKCVIVTNLFGHPAYLSNIRSWCDSNKVWMIEDNAQAPFAQEDGRYAGTVGHMGVFSLNVHKHIQCGEGGVVVTDDGALEEKLAGAINHGELNSSCSAGLNLRMTEPVAAIACAQLSKAERIIAGRIALAEELTSMVTDIPWIKPHTPDIGCRHVYYMWTALVDDPEQSRRFNFTNGLQQRGFPMLAGYTKPLHGVFGENVNLPVVQRVEYKQIITFHVCGWDPAIQQLKQMREMVKEASDDL